MRTWQDCPSYVEISVRSSDTKLAAAQQRQAEQIFTGISDQIASRTDEQMARRRLLMIGFMRITPMITAMKAKRYIQL